MSVTSNREEDNELAAVEYLFCEDFLSEDGLHFAERTGLDGDLAA